MSPALVKNLRVLLMVIISSYALSAWGQIPTGYYDAAQGLTGAELKSALHDIISDHTRYPYTSTSTDVWDILKETDEDPENTDNVILIYTGRSQPKIENSGESSTPGSNRWNREHIWSKSHGFPEETDTAYTDIHHLRPADESVNSSRNTLDFDNGGSPHVEATECFYDSDSWEPRDAVKGDIARMMFYMVVRYDPGYHTDNSVYDLELVDHTGTLTWQPTFGKLSTLLQWHVQDPVDDFEANRHEIIYGYQGNRNPFVDHPEWVGDVFNSQLGNNTQVGFAGSSLMVDEDSGSILLDLVILNPDAEQATQCEISLTGGTGSPDDLNGFESEVITFPPGNAAIQTLEIQITDDLLPEDRELFIFGISSVTGGDSAAANGNDSFVLTINPSDNQSALPGLIISEVMDGNRAGGSPKFLEITNVSGASIDIGGLQVWRGTNGANASYAVDITNGATLVHGQSWVIAYSAGDMLNAGFSSPDQTSGSINGNGNDVYQLRTQGEDLIDAFGQEGTDTPWYENKQAERIPSISGTRSNYNPAEWVFVSLNVGEPVNGSPGSPGTHVFDPVSATTIQVPESRQILTAYPNPFNHAATIHYEIPSSASQVRLDIFDLKGNLIETLKSGPAVPGTHDLTWDAKHAGGEDLTSGIYILKLTVDDETFFHRVILLK